MSTPTVTVFGSCRVHTPCSILEKSGKIRMNQKNIFGFVHYTPEIMQQFKLITGARQAPRRLRPYLNIPELWKDPPSNSLEYFHEMFQDTDIFVIEVSSVRQIKFKALYLQINRTRELLAADETILKEWWEPLARFGVKNMDRYPFDKVTPLQIEIANQIEISEQTPNDIYKDIMNLAHFLNKKLIVVSHFNLDYQGKSIPQRSIIVKALAKIADTSTIKTFDPTLEILRAGISNSIQDLGHYRTDYEPQIAECMYGKILEFDEDYKNELASNEHHPAPRKVG